MNNFFENKNFKNESKPKLSSQKIRDFIFRIENANTISSGQEERLGEKMKSFKEKYLGDIDERIEGGMLARSYITDFGLTTEKAEDNSKYQNRIIVLDENLLKNTFENLFNEMKKNKDLNEPHYAVTELMHHFHESLTDENVGEMNKFEIMQFTKNNIVGFVEECDVLYQEKGLNKDNLISSNSAYKSLVYAAKAMENHYLNEYVELNNNGLILEEDLRTEISEHYLYLRVQNEHENINTINKFITDTYNKIKVLIDIINKNKEEDGKNEKLNFFLDKIKNGVLENNKNLVDMIKKPEKLISYGINDQKSSLFDERVFGFFDEIENQLRG